MDEDVIDIQKYLDPSPQEGGRAFSVWGGDGERARFALPIWRAVFLLGGERGGIFHQEEGGAGDCVSFFVLDLGEDPARTTYLPPPEPLPVDQEAPALLNRDGGEILVFLGKEEGKKWFLEISGGEGRALSQGKKREELLFLAGECAGLLFFRGFAQDTGI